MNLNYVRRAIAPIIFLSVCSLMIFGGCQLALSPTTPSGPDSLYYVEVADNPPSSPFYTEPLLDYGVPGQGPDNTDTVNDPQLASFHSAQHDAATMLMLKPDIMGTGRVKEADGSQTMIVFTTTAGKNLVPQSIGGIRTRVIVTGVIRALAASDSGYRGEYRDPLPCGVSIGNSREFSSGTLGAIVMKHGIRYALSNNHVLARENFAFVGEPIVQPGRADANLPTQVGVLSAYKLISFSQTNYIDAAVARLTTQNAYDEADQFRVSHVTSAAQQNMAVMKVGRTTGLTYGIVQATNVQIKVTYHTSDVALFDNQIYISGAGFLKAGDSGSLLVTQDGNHPVGLCFAGGNDGAFANPIDPVLQYFGVQIAGTPN